MLRTLTTVVLSMAVCLCAQAQETMDLSEQETFLLEAEITELTKVGIGTTGSSVATLRRGDVVRKAGIQTIDLFEEKFITETHVEFNFKDSWKFNVAGYLVDRLIQLNMVPATVSRRVKGEPASVSMWVDNVKMDGVEFIDGGHAATASDFVKDQRDQAAIFQQLIENTDPNLGNWLIDGDERVWLIDFSRAFRRGKKLSKPEVLDRIGEGLLERLRNFDGDLAKKELKKYMDGPEIKALAKRAEVVVEHFDARIAKLGADAVLIRRDGF